MSTATPAARPDPDAELAAAIESGDRKRALTLLMDRFGPDVRRSALSRVGDEHLADDVLQQVFAEAYRDLGQLSSPTLARRWLLGITRHRSLDAVKKRTKWWQRYRSMPADPEDDDPSRPELTLLGSDPEQVLEQAALVKILKRCMARLAPAAREAVELCYGQELSHEDVAVIVRGRPGAVQKRISRAIIALRTCVLRRIGGAK